MHTLTRTVRLSVLPPPPEGVRGPEVHVNGFAGWPTMSWLGAHHELDVTVRGVPDPVTGYLLDIKVLDRAVRQGALEAIRQAVFSGAGLPPLGLAPRLAQAVGAHIPMRASLIRLRWRLSPFYSLEVHMPDTTHVLVRQRFDFAAAHRLHAPSLSDEANRAAFGKCNNPRGHGHNYQFEPTVRVPVQSDGLGSLPLHALESLVEATLLARFDHTHLNEDTQEFDQRRGGVNPSVENIAKVFFELLAPALARQAPDARLESMTVWETDRTSATYPG